MKKAVETAQKAIKEMSKPVSGKKDITRVAAISAESDEVGEMVADAMEKVGKNGVITIEEAKTMQTSVDVVEGMQFDKGYLSAYMCNDKDKMVANMDEPYILITDKKISNIQDILPILEQISKAGKELLIIAEDVTGEALTTLIVNSLRGTLKVVAVKAPGYGDNRAKSVKVTKDSTTIVDGEGKSEDIQERITSIKAQAEKATSEYDKKKYLDRIAKMSGGVGVIRIGAATETEMKESKYRVEDALNATKAAVEEGIIAGGGSAYIHAQKAVLAEAAKLEGDEKTGALIVARALEAPLRTIVENAGLEGAIVVNKVKESADGIGFDAVSEEYVDMMANGIIDPVKVTDSALVNAESIASTLLTTEAAVGNIPEKKPAMPASPEMGY